MSESRHTPTPWAFHKAKRPTNGEFDFGIYAVIDGKPKIIAEAFGRAGKDIRPDAEANAAFIVRAVNAHEDLLKTLQGALIAMTLARALPGVWQEYDFDPIIKECAAAIAKATVGTP